MSYLSIENILAEPERPFVIQAYHNSFFYLGIGRSNNNDLNKTIIQNADKGSAAKWTLIKNPFGQMGLICDRNVGSLQVPIGTNQSPVQTFSGQSFAQSVQIWNFKPQAVNSTVYFIQTLTNPKRVLDIKGYSYTDGTIVYAHRQNSSNQNSDRNQKWRFLWAS